MPTLFITKSATVKKIRDKNVSNLVWQYLVQSVTVTAQCDSAVGRHIIYIYVLVYVDNKLSLGVNLVHNASKIP